MNRNTPLVDGGYVTVPTVGFMNTDGDYDVEGFGVAPDIEVENMPDESPWHARFCAGKATFTEEKGEVEAAEAVTDALGTVNLVRRIMDEARA